MPRAAQATGLEVDRDEQFQRREWLVQRISWGMLTGVIILGLLGGFGGGPLAHATASDTGVPIRLDYDRMVRLGAISHLRLVLDPTAIRPDGIA
ncbi:MAG TPA: hypothetical protein VNC60_02985, partial [Actinomycetota bacterium]|nr:hypothetical protein [Actinomycetota bacterium]